MDYDELLIKYADVQCDSDFNWPTHVLDKRAQSDPDMLALHWVSADFKSEQTVTYRQLADDSSRLALALSEHHGLKKGDR